VKYGIVFVISAGNHHDDIVLDMSRDEWNGLSTDDKEAAVVRALYRNARHRQLLSPAESINGLTVGALHSDNATVTDMGRRINLFSSILPSPVSAFGNGYRRAVKPELLCDGGRVLYVEPVTNDPRARFEWQQSRIAPGQCVASPGIAAGDVRKVAYCCGTSMHLRL
jgi:hypothetical protein